MERYKALLVAGAAYRFVGGHLRDCLVLAAVPMLAATAVLLAVTFLVAGGAGAGEMTPMRGATFTSVFLLGLAGGLAQIVLYVMFAVAWHRHYLVGEDAATPFAILRWRRRHWRFALKGVLLVILFFVIMMIVSLIALPMLGGLLSHAGPNGGPMAGFFTFALLFNVVVGLAVYYFGSRFLLAFPAAAVDDTTVGLSASWDLTDGNSLRFFAALILVAGPFMLLEYLGAYLGVALFGRALFSPSLAAILIVVQQALYFIAIALTTTAASITYRTLKELDTAARAAAGETA